MRTIQDVTDTAQKVQEVAGAASKVSGAVGAFKQTSTGSVAIGSGPKSGLFRMIQAQSSRGLRIKKESAPIKEVMKAFMKHFRGDEQALATIGFKGEIDDEQKWYSRLWRGKAYVISVGVGYLNNETTHYSREDLRVYMVFQHFILKRGSEDSIKSHVDLISAIVPAVFELYAKIPQTAELERRRYKVRGMERLHSFLQKCTDIVKKNKGYFEDISGLCTALESTRWSSYDATRRVDVSPHITDYITALEEQLAMSSVWLQKIIFHCLGSETELPADIHSLANPRTDEEWQLYLFSQDGHADDIDVEFSDCDERAAIFDVDEKLRKATVLQELYCKKRDIYWQLMKNLHYPELVKVCLKRYYSLKSDDNMDRRFAQENHSSKRYVTGDQHCEISKKRCLVLQRLKTLLQDMSSQARVKVFMELESAKVKSSVHQQYRKAISDLFDCAVDLNFPLLMMTFATHQFYEVCVNQGDTATKIKGLRAYLSQIEILNGMVNGVLNKMRQVLRSEEMKSGVLFSSSGRKHFSKHLIGNKINQSWVMQIVSSQGLSVHCNHIAAILSELGGICRSASTIHPNSRYEKNWRLALAVFDRDERFVTDLITKQLKLQLPKEMIELLERLNVSERYRRDAETRRGRDGLSIIRRARVEDEEKKECDDDDDNEEGLQYPATVNISELIQHANMASAEAQYRLELQRAAVELLAKVFTAFKEYSYFVNHTVSWAGKNLTGTHTQTHVDAAEALYTNVKQLLDKSNVTADDIEDAKHLCENYTHPVKQGRLPRFFNAPPLRHPFDAFLTAATHFDVPHAPF